MANRRKKDYLYLTESQILEYFMNDSGSEIADNEDNALDFEPEDNISDNECFY